MRKQRGAMTLELLLTLCFGVLGLIMLVSLIHRVNQGTDVYDVMRKVERTFHAAQTHYAQSILKTQCLQSPSLSMASIGESNIDNNGRYTLIERSESSPYPHPFALQLTVHMNNAPDSFVMSDALLSMPFSYKQVSPSILEFTAPIEQSKELLQLNFSTGCYQ